MKVIIYARCSTDDKEQNPERQIMKCKQYCELHNHTIVNTYIDMCTGDSEPFTRPEGQKMLKEHPQGIVIFSMDRFTRQHPIKVIQMIKSLKDRGIMIISITEPAFNMESDFSEVIMYLLTWVNNYFLTKLKRDVRAGMDRARAQGKQIGRTKVEFNKYRAYQLLFKEKKSLTQVNQELGVSRTTLYRFKKGIEQNPSLVYKYATIP